MADPDAPATPAPDPGAAAPSASAAAPGAPSPAQGPAAGPPAAPGAEAPAAPADPRAPSDAPPAAGPGDPALSAGAPAAPADLPSAAPAPEGWGALLDLLGVGGPVVLILAALSLAALTVIFAKLLQFARAGLGERAAEAARAAAERLRRGHAPGPLPPHPAGELVALAEAARAAGRHDRDAVREELERVGRERLAGLRSHLRLLEITGALAPLLGLFGTVLGMIEAFRALERAGGAVDPATLSGGIWQALLTTAVGLAVAMPTVAALAWLERRVERAAEAMDDVLARLCAPPIAGAGPVPAPERRHAAE